MINEKLIDGSQFAEFSLNILEKASDLGYDTTLYEATPKDKNYYSVGHMIPLANKACEERIISNGWKKDIFLDLFRHDKIYKNCD